MASRYSVTIQLADSSLGEHSPGHAAVVINTPDGQTYAGLGPAYHDLRRGWGGAWSSPSFKPRTVPPETLPADASNPENYSTVFSHKSYKTFTIPISESQAADALAEIKRIEASGDSYNLFTNYCTLTVNKILEAAGFGPRLLYSLPSRSIQYLSDVENTLARNPNSKYTLDGNKNIIRIPEALRGVQQDYAYVGGGYDAPSERIHRDLAHPSESDLTDRQGMGRPGSGRSNLPSATSDGKPDYGDSMFSPISFMPASDAGALTLPVAPADRALTRADGVRGRSDFPSRNGGSTMPSPQTGETSGEADDRPIRFLGRYINGQLRSSPFGDGVQPDSLIRTDNASSPDPQSLDSRFGSGPNSAASSVPPNSFQAVSPPQAGPPLGSFSGKPMLWPPVPIFDILNRSGVRNDSAEDAQNSIPLFEKYFRYLNRANGS